jgi:hypothetical protein
VHQLGSLKFDYSPQSLMQLKEWRTFLQHPNAQRVGYVNIDGQPSLCDATTVSLLGQLACLSSLRLHLPAAAAASFLLPLVNCPSLAVIDVVGPTDDSATIPAPLEPLARCTRLRLLSLQLLTLRAGQLSELLMQLAQAGSQLQELRLGYLRMLPMDDSVLAVARESADDAMSLELILAAHSLTHLRELRLCSASSALDCVLCLPSLRVLMLSLELLPSAMKLELLLRRLPHLRCTFRYNPAAPPVPQQIAARLPQLLQLAQQHPRFVFEVVD